MLSLAGGKMFFSARPFRFIGEGAGNRLELYVCGCRCAHSCAHDRVVCPESGAPREITSDQWRLK